MGEALTIKKDTNIKLESYPKSYLYPKYIFIPIKKGFRLRVIDNSYVYKNDIVMFTNTGKSVHSGISGRVLGVKDMLYYNGKKISSLVIENDFKENIRMRKSTKKYIDNYDKESFFEILEDTSLYYKGEYVIDKFKTEKKNLVINGVELEPYFGNKYFTCFNNASNILETADLLGELFGYENIIVAIKSNESDLINKFMDSIGTFPKIELRLISDQYPNGLNEILAKTLRIEDALILDSSELLDIYNVLKKQVPVSEKLITITGNAVKPRCSIKVKLGTLLSEVFINNFDFTYENVDVYLNGIMSGEKVNSLKYVIDTNIDGLVIMKKEEKTVSDCINCGLCSKNCPVHLNPKYVFDHNGVVRDEYKEACLQCGLCNYCCPANIDLRRAMKGVKRDE